VTPADLADALQPVDGLPGRQRLRSSIIDLGTGCTTDTFLHDRRPSVPRRRNKNLEQSATGSDVFRVSANIRTKLKTY